MGDQEKDPPGGEGSGDGGAGGEGGGGGGGGAGGDGPGPKRDELRDIIREEIAAALADDGEGDGDGAGGDGAGDGGGEGDEGKPRTPHQIEDDLEKRVRAEVTKIRGEEQHQADHEKLRKPPVEKIPAKVGRLRRAMWGDAE